MSTPFARIVRNNSSVKCRPAVGAAIGLIIGALPGLGPLFAVALMLPLTYGMNSATAIILLAASAISAALVEVINASIIVPMVLLSVALNFIQTYRSQRAVDRIRSAA